MTERIVSKAGGTSNATAEAVQQSMAWAEQANILVVSAPGELPDGSKKVTHMLLDARTQFVDQGTVSSQLTDAITTRYAMIIDAMGRLPLPRGWIDKVSSRVKESAAFSKAAASTLGERLQAEIYETAGFNLLSPLRAPHSLGTDRYAWRGWLAGIVDPNKKYVMPGNTTLVDGHLETISLGGSDVTAGLAAFAVDADLHQTSLMARPYRPTQNY